MEATLNLGIQSYTFRAFKTIEQLTGAIQKLGLSHVEIWPGHLSYELGAKEQRKALSMLKEAGLMINGYGAVDFNDNEAHNRSIFDFAERAGVKALTVVNTDVRFFQAVEELCEEYDINIAIHNHGLKLRWGTMDDMQRALSSASKRFGVCIDTAWAIDAREEPLEWLDRFHDRLFGVHLKDFSYEGGEHRDVIVGTGGLNLPAFLSKLKQYGFSGYMSMEYEGDADNPLPSAIECVGAIRKVMNSL